MGCTSNKACVPWSLSVSLLPAGVGAEEHGNLERLLKGVSMPWKWPWSATIESIIPVAGYTVVRDQPMSLGVGGDIDATFTFELTDFSAASANYPVIVSLMLRASVGLKLEILLNDYNWTNTYADGRERAIYEVIGPAARYGENELTVRVAEGSCRFSDLVVWVTRELHV